MTKRYWASGTRFAYRTWVVSPPTESQPGNVGAYVRRRESGSVSHAMYGMSGPSLDSLYLYFAGSPLGPSGSEPCQWIVKAGGTTGLSRWLGTGDTICTVGAMSWAKKAR